MSETKYASFAPADVKESGGSKLWDNVVAKITGFRFTKEMPDGYTITPAPGETISPVGVYVDFEVEGQAPVEERRVNQFFSVGAKVGLSFDIAQGGYALVKKSDDSTLYTSNFTKFVKSMVENGLSAAVVQAGDFSKILGLVGHFKRIEDKDGRDREWTDKKGVKHTEKPKILLCTKVLTPPSAGAASNTTTTGATAVASGEVDIDGAAMDALLAALKAKKKPIQRSGIVLLVSQQVVDNPNRAAIAKRAGEEEFLVKLADAGIVTYGAAEKGQPVSLPAAA